MLCEQPGFRPPQEPAGHRPNHRVDDPGRGRRSAPLRSSPPVPEVLRLRSREESVRRLPWPRAAFQAWQCAPAPAFWTAGQVAVRQRENSFKHKYERYISANPADADLKRKALTAVAAKMARVAYGMVKKNQPYRQFFEHSFPADRSLSAEPSGRRRKPRIP